MVLFQLCPLCVSSSFCKIGRSNRTDLCQTLFHSFFSRQCLFGPALALSQTPIHGPFIFQSGGLDIFNAPCQLRDPFLWQPLVMEHSLSNFERISNVFSRGDAYFIGRHFCLFQTVIISVSYSNLDLFQRFNSMERFLKTQKTIVGGYRMNRTNGRESI